MKYKLDLETVKQYVKESINFTEVLIKLNIPRRGNNHNTLKNFLNNNNIDYSHFTGRARKYKTNYKNSSEYLSSCKLVQSSVLKNKLLKEGVLENKCDLCGLTNWLNKPIVLQLHHKDGNNKNNSIENLQILCPNCHSQTSNYCGNSNKRNINTCKDCGIEISRNSTYCTICSRKHYNHNSKKPNYEQLILDFKILKYFSKVGEKYSVSDNAVRKWCKSYNIPTKYKELNNFIKNIDAP